MDDPRLWVLREALASYASDPDDPPIEEDDTVQAAVSLVLRGGDPVDFLIIKRAEHEDDPWAGHMALPGGRRESVDGDLADTAVRETLEETGVDLDELGDRLGRLEEVAPSGARLPRLTITPFVYAVPDSTRAKVASREVAHVHWVRLADLHEPANRGTIEMELPGGTRSFPCFRVAGEVVWGLTYRILEDFLAVWAEEAPTRPTPR